MLDLDKSTLLAPAFRALLAKNGKMGRLRFCPEESAGLTLEDGSAKEVCAQRADAVRAVYYCVEQAYETGQSLPVTGGQIMLS